jgi:hypothetical protein
MKHKGLLSLAAAFVIVGALFGSAVFAQDSGGNGFQVSPVRVELTIAQGNAEKAVITAYNPTSQNINADVVVNDFEAATDETGQPKVIFEADKTAPGNSFKSLVGDLGTVSIPAGDKVEIPVTVTVPENASPGGYYGAIRLEPTVETDKNVNLSASVGTIFLVTVPGDLKEALELVEFTAAKGTGEENEVSTGRFFVGGGENIKIVTRLKNTGNIHVKPFGRVQVADSKGNVVEQYEFNNTEPKSNVLPDSTRKFTDELNYTNFFGKYTITANLGYGSAGNLITAKNTFYVVPVWLVVVAIALLILVIVGIFLLYRKLRQNRKHKVNARR